MKKILLLGSKSFVGKKLLEFLNKEKDLKIKTLQSYFLESDITSMTNNDFKNKYFTKFDINFDIIINLIHIHKNNLNEELIYNLQLSKKIIFFSKVNNSKLIYFSSVNINNDKSNKYGYVKKILENELKNYHDYLIVRPSTIIERNNTHYIGGKNGESLNIINKFLNKSFLFPIVGKGDYLHTICFLDNLCDFIIQNCKKNYLPNTTVNFFSGEYLTYKEFINYLKKKKNKRIPNIYIPVNLIKFLIIFINFLKISKLNFQMIDNLTSQKIEFDKTNEITKFLKIKTLRHD